MTDWTPGPWQVVDGFDLQIGYPRPGNPSRIDSVLAAPEALANARLMAAAPTLYEAVERARRHAMNIGITDGSYLAQLDSALALARGDTPNSGEKA